MPTNDLLLFLGINSLIVIIAFYFISSMSKKSQLEAMEQYSLKQNEESDKNLANIKKMLEQVYKGISDGQKSIVEDLNENYESLQKQITNIGIQIESSKNDLSSLLKANSIQAESILTDLHTLSEKINGLKTFNSDNFNMISHEVNNLKREIEDKLNVQTEFLRELTSDFKDF